MRPIERYVPCSFLQPTHSIEFPTPNATPGPESEWSTADRLGDPVMKAALEQQERVGEEVVGAEKVAPHADRPGCRGHVERQGLLDLVQQVERVAALAVELVDKSDDRHVAQAANLEELAGLLLDALWCIGGGVEWPPP